MLEATAPSTVRQVPIEGVVITDAELDHSLGIVLLREARVLPIYATAAAQAILEYDSRVLPLTRTFSDVPLTTLPLDGTTPLNYRDGASSGLTVEAFEVPAGPPRFASHARAGHTVGLVLRESDGGRSCAFVPGCGAFDDRLRNRLSRVDALFFDGTFWSDDELIRLGIGERTARQLDHLPVGGPDGSLAALEALPCAHRIYTHINNTNPMLLEQSPERAAVDAAGITVGFDGLRLLL
jgi:pyrroloquinoline quinone biosynthesis protein B